MDEGEAGFLQGVLGLGFKVGNAGEAGGGREGVTEGVLERGEAALASGGDGDEGDAEVFAQSSGVDAEALGFGAIDFVQSGNDGVAEVDDLKKEVEVALEIGGIENAEDEVGFGLAILAAEEDLPGDFFVGGICLGRVGAGEIDEFEEVAVWSTKGAGFAGDGRSSIVANLLVWPGEGVKESGLSGVGISDQGNLCLDG